MSKVHTYTSTGKKILRHPDLIRLLHSGKARPHSLQLAVTNKCNLKCAFCSVAQRDSKEELPADDILHALKLFRDLGTKTVEITGGGEPMLHPYINEIVYYAYILRLQIGLITNGTLLEKLKNPETLSWLRISANSLDYGKEIFIPKLHKDAHLGFSYCFDYDGDSTIRTLWEVRDLAIKHNVKYVRVVPNCIGEIESKHRKIAEIVSYIGAPLFYQRKTKAVYKNCLVGYIKPFLNADGYVYPCSSTVLNDDADRQFNPKYRWYHWSDARKIYSGEIAPLDGTKCADCVFTENNQELDYIRNTQDCEEFL